MGVFSPMQLARRPVRSRVLAIYHGNPAALAERLPASVRPRLVHGRALVVLCYTRLGTLGSRFLPHRGACSNHLAYRVLVERERRGALQPETWVARRETSSRLGAGLGERLFGKEHGRATFAIEEQDRTFTLCVSSGRGEELYLRAEPAPGSESRLFPGGREVQALLRASGDVHPADFLVPEADAIDARGELAPEPLIVHEIRSTFLDDPATFPEGTLEFDSAWRLVDRRLEPVRALHFAPSVRPAASSPAFPAC
jgi:hypothetical protein